MLDNRKEELRREIARRERELEKLDALPDLTQLADGTVLALFVAHGRSKPYTHVAFLTGGKFYLTGRTSPNGVSVDELANWLTTSGRRLVTAAVVGEISTVTVGVVAFDLGEALLDAVTPNGDVRRRGSEWRDRHPYFTEYGD